MKVFLQTVIPFVLTLIVTSANGQVFQTENHQLKGWTKETKIEYDDFKGKPNEQIRRLNKEAGLQASAKVTIKSVLDVPKRKRDKGRHLEKVYIAPFFLKTGSVTLTKDEGELDKQRIYLDIAEVVVRMARQDIENLTDSIKAYGVLWAMYSQIKSSYCSAFKEMADDYTYEVFIEKKPGAYEEWRALINKNLEETEKYATTDKDCHRLLTDEPIDSSYEMSKTIIGSTNGCN